MAKPTRKSPFVEPLGPWTPEDLDQIIEKLVSIAGELPAHQFEIEKYENGAVITYSGSARQKLQSALQNAHLLYRYRDDEGRGPSSKQVLAELRRIESAAHHILTLLESQAVRVGLTSILYQETRPLRDALRQAGVVLPRRSLDIFSSSGRFGTAVEGVEDLHRWAKAAVEENVRRIARMRSKKIGSGAARHKGNVALNKYIEAVVEECWRGVWGRQISDGPKLWRFVTVASAAVGEGLSEDASRERIRRIFGRRRADRRGLESDLPNLQAVDTSTSIVR
jgi:hypothetical protein